MKRLTARVCALTLVLAGISSPASAELIYGIAQIGNATAIVSFEAAAPRALLSSKFLTPGFGGGLQNNETIVAIDARLNGKIIGLGSGGGQFINLYEIDPNTGVATLQINSGSPPPNSGLNGFNFGFDWNPTIDRMRIVADTNKNMVADPNTWATSIVATPVFYPAGDPNAGKDPNIVHSAYDNNVPFAATSQLYGIDTGLDILVTQANNTGVLGTVGSLGIGDVTAYGGFDISAVTGTAYAALLPANSSQSSLYTINLATGTATSVGVIDGGLIITALTAAQIPEPATTALAVLAFAAIPLARRRG